MQIISLAFVLLITAGCATAPKYPRPASGFTLAKVGGGEVSLSEYRGKPLVMGMGATWCPHCLHEAPIFKRVYERYRGRVGMLGILVKSPAKDAEALVRKNGIEFNIALDPESEVKKAYGVTGIPVTFFIDSEGNIVDDNFGGIEEDELVEKIENLLN